MGLPVHRAGFVEVRGPIGAFLLDAGHVSLQAGHMPLASAWPIDGLGCWSDRAAELLLLSTHEPEKTGEK